VAKGGAASAALTALPMTRASVNATAIIGSAMRGHEGCGTTAPGGGANRNARPVSSFHAASAQRCLLSRPHED